MNRTVFLLLTALATAIPLAAQDRPAADPADVSSIDGIISAVYESLSGGIGVERNWDRNRSLYHASAKLTHSQWNRGGETAVMVPMTHEEHVNAVNGYSIREGFHETEIGRQVLEYGTIAHVFSTYSYHTETGVMEGRGINSFQLFFDGSRYWITSVVWSQEAPEHTIPVSFIQR